MNLCILCVGKVKEPYFREAIAEYVKRLGRYGKVSIVEVEDEKTPEGASSAQEEKIRQKEGKRLLEKLPDQAYLVTLEIEGHRLSSVQFSSYLEHLNVEGRGTIYFAIGGSLGLSKEVRSRSNYALSFSDMTFPHQLMRVILLEQLYRCCRIQHHEPYHK